MTCIAYLSEGAIQVFFVALFPRAMRQADANHSIHLTNNVRISFGYENIRPGQNFGGEDVLGYADLIVFEKAGLQKHCYKADYRAILNISYEKGSDRVTGNIQGKCVYGKLCEPWKRKF